MLLKAVIIFSVGLSVCSAQTDSMFVQFVDGTVRGYAISDIKELAFPDGMTSVKEQFLMAHVIENFTLRQNYPNPFNPTTTIQYEIPKTGSVDVAIFDIQGRLVRSLEHTCKQAGTHSVVWDGKNNSEGSISSGTYFCRVSFENKILVTKLVLIK